MSGPELLTLYDLSHLMDYYRPTYTVRSPLSNLSATKTLSAHRMVSKGILEISESRTVGVTEKGKQVMHELLHEFNRLDQVLA